MIKFLNEKIIEIINLTQQAINKFMHKAIITSLKV